MRWSLGLGPVGAALLLAAALPLVDGSGLLAGVKTAAAQSAPQDRKATRRQVAKSKSKGADADSKGRRGPTETDRLLDTAAKLIAEGNADAAMSTLDGILSGGGLANKHMARALYLRGVAHRKKARPAQAIADLTSATWLKDGLSDADRTAAFKERAEISRQIGVADAGASPSAASATPAPAPAPAAQFVRAPAAPTGVVRRPPQVGGPGLSEGGFPRVANAPSRPPPVAQTNRAPAAQTALVTRPPSVSPPRPTERGFAPIVTPAPPPRAAPEPSSRPQPVARTVRAPAAPGPSERGFTPIVTAAPKRTALPPPRAEPDPRAASQTLSRPEPIVQTSPAPAVPTSQAPALPAGLVRRPPRVGDPGLSEGGFPRVTASAPPPASPPPRASSSGDSAAENAGKATSSWQSERQTGQPYGWVSADDRQKSRVVAPAPGESPYSGGGVGQFFSGLFGVAPGSAPPPERVTESVETPSSPSDQERTTRRVVEKPSERSVAVVTSAIPPSSNAAQGAYRLQIALVRNRSEANALAERVRKEYGRAFGARKLEVDQTVLGNMGTFYRVRLGPFAAVDESKALCDQLRTKGYDCLVVMR